MAARRLSEPQTLPTVERLVAEALPPGWSPRVSSASPKSARRVGALWTVASPDGSTAMFVVEAKRVLQGS